MERPDRTKIPITDANTYLKWDSNQVVLDYEKYAKDLDAYIDYVERLPHPIKFGRWLLKNAVPMFNKEGLLCWYKENSEKDTHELYDEFIKDETLPPQD